MIPSHNLLLSSVASLQHFPQAQQSFQSSANCILLTVVYGQSTVGGCSAEIGHDTVPATFSWLNCPKLIEELRERRPPLFQPSAGPRQKSVLPTFLYAVRQATLNDSSRTSALYSHNGEIYRLDTERQQHNGSGEVLIVGRTRRDRPHYESEFRLWMAVASETQLPLRIEFRAKSYLKLTLEPDESQAVPVFDRILKETEF